MKEDTYESGKKYTVGSQIVYLQYEWKCTGREDYCSMKEYNPVGELGLDTWTRYKIVSSDFKCETKPVEGTDDGTPPDPGTNPGSDTPDADKENQYYDPKVDPNSDGEFKVPTCMGYPLLKYNKDKTDFEYGSLVYQRGKRYSCWVVDWCNDSIFEAAFFWDSAWKGVPEFDALDLSKDTYSNQNEYAKYDSVVIHGNKYICLIGGWCSQKAFHPLGNHGGSAWKWDGSLDLKPDKCYDPSSPNSNPDTNPDTNVGYDNKEICRSFYIKEYRENSSNYISGTLVVKDNQIYRCINSLTCMFSTYKPGSKYAVDTWTKIDPKELTDLTNDNYYIGKSYKISNKIIYQQHEFECITSNGKCSITDYNPFTRMGKEAWKLSKKLIPSITCSDDKVLKDGVEIKKIETDGNQHYDGNSRYIISL